MDNCPNCNGSGSVPASATTLVMGADDNGYEECDCASAPLNPDFGPLERHQMDKLDSFTADAKAIAWDGCHKIYVLMDDEQVAKMRLYGYDPLITSNEMTPSEMSAKVVEWFDESCELRFISAVHTDHDNPNNGFTDVISQFEIEHPDWDSINI